MYKKLYKRHFETLYRPRFPTHFVHQKKYSSFHAIHVLVNLYACESLFPVVNLIKSKNKIKINTLADA